MRPVNLFQKYWKDKDKILNVAARCLKSTKWKMLNTSGTLKRQNIIKARHQVKLVKEQVCRDIPGQECKIELVNCDHDGDYGGGGGGSSGDGKDVRNKIVQFCRILLKSKNKMKKKLGSFHP